MTDRAEATRHLRSSVLAAVLSALAAHPMTADDLAIVLPMLPRKDTGRRLSMLKTLGLAELTGETLTTRKGNSAVVYRATELGAGLADRWSGPPPAQTIRRGHEAGSVPIAGNGTDESWACPIHRRAWGNPRGLLLHFERYCPRITVSPREDTP